MSRRYSRVESAAIGKVGAIMWLCANESGLTRAEIARRMELTRSNVSHILSGSQNVTIATLAKFLDVCGWEMPFNPTCIERIGRASSSTEAPR